MRRSAAHSEVPTSGINLRLPLPSPHFHLGLRYLPASPFQVGCAGQSASAARGSRLLLALHLLAAPRLIQGLGRPETLRPPLRFRWRRFDQPRSPPGLRSRPPPSPRCYLLFRHDSGQTLR